MKRKTVKLEQKAWRYENIYPQYVSIVKTGANYIPFSTLKFSDELDQEITEGYDVQSVSFPVNFSEDKAKEYLESKNFSDYELLTKEDGSYYVDSKSVFEDTKVIELPEGIKLTVGKTETASVQLKTKIEESTPLLQMEETQDEALEVLELGEDLEETKEADISEGADEEVPEENAEPIEDTSVEVSLAESESIKAMLKLKFATDNDYLNRVDSRKIWLVIDLLTYNLIDNVAYALQEDDRDAKVRATTSDFADAVLKLYGALDTVTMKEDIKLSDKDDEIVEDEDIDGTGATIIGEEEPEFTLTHSEDLLETVRKLKEEVEALKLAATVDTEEVLMQTSKADQRAYDKEDLISMSEQKTTNSPITQAQKNNFGII